MRLFCFLFLIGIFGITYSQADSTDKNNKKKISLSFDLTPDENNEIMIDSISINIPIYNVDSCLNNILDEVINTEKRCPSYRNGKSLFYIRFKNRKDTCKLTIWSSHYEEPEYKRSFGYFIFKDQRFVCLGDYNKDFLHITPENPIKYKYKESNEPSILGIDDSSSEWIFIYTEFKYYCRYKRICEGYK